MPALRFILLLSPLLLLLYSADAQSVVQGTITQEDSIPITGVTVLNKRNNASAVSNDHGIYEISARKGDTLLLKALGYVPLLVIISRDRSALIHHLKRQPLELKSVSIIHYNYLRDSLRLREEFRKEFDFRRPRWNEVIRSVGPFVGVNINKLYKAVSFKQNKKKDKFKKILLAKEKENQVQRVFNPLLINKLTGLEGDSLTQFMTRYQPSYEFIKDINDYDLYVYIKQKYARYVSDSIK
ncbi:peptidase associated/transthyretin-like domain-containing protein [Chitinophaga flava]|uniref:Carboxypeptidase-like regulatory domain-containing protein n=1 Tax=Chitinophaga flava TaxID=2259036 RepID=A0A365Y5J3_9BACT|nr:hypothetical protein [Chitinophaga flava]RBL93856.1 hypothetical protein DF182_15295 [Chitinophaga flava]